MKRLIILLAVFLLANPPPPISILLLGDSVTYGAGGNGRGYAILLAEHLGPGYKVVNMGLSGASSWSFLQKKEAELVGLQADIIVIYFGSNDVRRPVYMRDAQVALLELAAIPSKRTIFLTPHKGINNEAKNYDLLHVEAYGDSFVEPFRYRSKTEVIDLYEICCTAEQMADYIHPNEAGHALIAEVLYRTIVNDDH